MPRIHTPGSHHHCNDRLLCGPTGFPHPRNDNGREVRWDPYRPHTVEYALLSSAFQWIQANIVDPAGASHASCDERFSSFGYHMAFSDWWRNNHIWISYNPDGATPSFGAHLPNTLDITIAKIAFGLGLRQVVGTLIHEIAHINGAGSGQEAESTLNDCGCSDVYNRSIVGSRQGLRFPLSRLG